MRAITRVVGASAAAVLALTLAGCGSSDDGASPATSSSDTTSATDQKPTSAPDDEKDAPSGDLTADTFYTVLASSMQEGTSYRMTTTTSGSGITSTVKGAVVITDGVPAMSMTMSGSGFDSTIVLVDNTYYMNMGELTGGKFMVIDLSDPSNPLGASLGSIEDLSNPEKSISLFKDTVKSVEKVGQEDVGGVSATHYKVALDGSAAASAVTEALGGEDPTALPSMPAEFVYDFWVDGDGRPAKMSTAIGGISTEATYSDWNDSSITVEKPSADQLSDLSFEDLLGGASS